jgi:prepilin-type N-terminal cleavage/methylation domain-containing protein/prepilin-type processing-associated H-X9-DG protein
MRPNVRAAAGRRGGFTLIELLVVIAIIAVLIGLLLPAVQKVRESAANTQCKNNLKQIGIAVFAYHDANGRFPAGSIYRPNASGAYDYYDTWAIAILPWIEQGNLFKLYDPTLPNATTASANMNILRQTYVKTYACPSDPNSFLVATPASGPGGQTGLPIPVCMPGNYRCCAGADWGGQDWGVDQNGSNENWDDMTQAIWLYPRFGADRGVMHASGVYESVNVPVERVQNIKDGTSNTLMAGEYTTMTSTNRRTYWAYAYTSYNESVATYAQSRTLIADFDGCTNTAPGNSNQCKRAWGSFHSNGHLNFVFCDGGVRQINTNIDMNLVFPAMATIAGGEVFNYNL